MLYCYQNQPDSFRHATSAWQKRLNNHSKIMRNIIFKKSRNLSFSVIFQVCVMSKPSGKWGKAGKQLQCIYHTLQTLKRTRIWARGRRKKGTQDGQRASLELADASQSVCSASAGWQFANWTCLSEVAKAAEAAELSGIIPWNSNSNFGPFKDSFA